MFTPVDTAHLTHRADRHVPAGDATREANRRLRAARRDALRACIARVFARDARHVTA